MAGVRDIVRVSRARSQRVRSASADVYTESGGALAVVPYLGGPVDRKVLKSIAESMPDNPLMFGPLWRIAMRMASYPLKVYTFGEGGVRTEDPTHPAYKLLRRPNPVVTRNLMVGHVILDLFTHGKAGWLKVREGSGPPVELWPLYGSTLGVVPDARNLIKGFTVTVNGRKHPLRMEDVCYFRLLADPNALAEGITPFTPLRKIGGLGGTAIDAGTDMFDHAILGRLSVQLKRELSPKAFNRLKRQIEAVRRDKFAVPVLDSDAELKDHEGPSDEVIINALGSASKIIADTLGIPEKSDTAEFLRNAIQPVADAIEQELERSLMSEFDGDAFPQFAFRDELRGDPLQRAQLHKERIWSMQETPDEARRDEDRGPLPNGVGAQVFGPLNMVPIELLLESDGSPEPRDTKEGLGGDEGKGTLAAAGSSKKFAARAKANWSTLRDRVVRKHSEAMARKIRGVINKEAKSVKATLNEGRSARAATGFPSIAELRDIIGKSDAQVVEILEQFMRQTGEASAPTAAQLVDLELTDEALDRLNDVFASRAAAVADRFTGVRADRIIRLVETAVEKGTPARELAAQIGDAYSKLSTAYTDGIARTEVAFAHEQAALVTWADAGIRQIEVVHGGGDCTTGVCEDNAAGSPYRLGETMDNVGVSFEGADAPPFHPGCTCFVVPFIEEA